MKGQESPYLKYFEKDYLSEHALNAVQCIFLKPSSYSPHAYTSETIITHNLNGIRIRLPMPVSESNDPMYSIVKEYGKNGYVIENDHIEEQLTNLNRLLLLLETESIRGVNVTEYSLKPKPKSCVVCKNDLTDYGGSCKKCLKTYCSVSCFQEHEC